MNFIRNLSKIVLAAVIAFASLGGMAVTQSVPASAQPYHHGPGPGYYWHGRHYHHRHWHPAYYGPGHRYHAGFWVYL